GFLGPYRTAGSLRGCRARGCGRVMRGSTCRYWKASYKTKKRRAALGSARRVSRFVNRSTPFEPEPRQELHEAGGLSIEFWRGGVIRHCKSIKRVKGCEPFRVPSHPGMAIEKRPAVPPATRM